MPIPPVKRTAGRVALCPSVIQPKGPWRRSSEPSGNELRVRLKTVLRRRMATIRFRSCGALAMERARVLPSRSVSPGLSKVKFKNCPASNSNSSGFSKQKAVVPALGDNHQAMNLARKKDMKSDSIRVSCCGRALILSARTRVSKTLYAVSDSLFEEVG
jgi:hypothetical protein